jgi:hypothetical protein
MLNALANHGFLPHDGKDITVDMAVNALTTKVNLGEGIATTLSKFALMGNKAPGATTFNLDQLSPHGFIEHDASISRQDASLGDNHSFNQEIFDSFLASHGNDSMTSLTAVSRARYSRVLASKAAQDEKGVRIGYGVKELVLSYGEQALYLAALGGIDNEGVVPIEYVKVLFGKNLISFILYHEHNLHHTPIISILMAN